MQQISDIISALGGPTEVGRICGFERNPGARGTDMKRRKSIPVRYWPRLIEAARRRGVQGITHKALCDAHASEIVNTSMHSQVERAI